MVILIVILLTLVFVKFRVQNNTAEKPRRPNGAEAALSIKGFRHKATSEGRTSWILNAESARLFSDQNRAELSDVNMTFYTKDRKQMHLTAQNGEFDTNTRDISLMGSVTGRYQGYTLTSENLHYNNESRIIYTNTHVKVKGKNLQFTADSGEFKINPKTLILDGSVQVRMNGTGNP